ncbi:MAG: hypothetical protein HY901_22195 [Deltaproteobacteria bacterium]|nr:hypothetical protein [Deltaproteobacteria bacterium]
MPNPRAFGPLLAALCLLLQGCLATVDGLSCSSSADCRESETCIRDVCVITAAPLPCSGDCGDAGMPADLELVLEQPTGTLSAPVADVVVKLRTSAGVAFDLPSRVLLDVQDPAGEKRAPQPLPRASEGLWKGVLEVERAGTYRLRARIEDTGLQSAETLLVVNLCPQGCCPTQVCEGAVCQDLFHFAIEVPEGRSFPLEVVLRVGRAPVSQESTIGWPTPETLVIEHAAEVASHALSGVTPQSFGSDVQSWKLLEPWDEPESGLYRLTVQGHLLLAGGPQPFVVTRLLAVAPALKIEPQYNHTPSASGASALDSFLRGQEGVISVSSNVHNISFSLALFGEPLIPQEAPVPLTLSGTHDCELSGGHPCCSSSHSVCAFFKYDFAGVGNASAGSPAYRFDAMTGLAKVVATARDSDGLETLLGSTVKITRLAAADPLPVRANERISAPPLVLPGGEVMLGLSDGTKSRILLVRSDGSSSEELGAPLSGEVRSLSAEKVNAVLTVIAVTWCSDDASCSSPAQAWLLTPNAQTATNALPNHSITRNLATAWLYPSGFANPQPVFAYTTTSGESFLMDGLDGHPLLLAFPLPMGDQPVALAASGDMLFVGADSHVLQVQLITAKHSTTGTRSTLWSTSAGDVRQLALDLSNRPVGVSEDRATSVARWFFRADAQYPLPQGMRATGLGVWVDGALVPMVAEDTSAFEGVVLRIPLTAPTDTTRLESIPARPLGGVLLGSGGSGYLAIREEAFDSLLVGNVTGSRYWPLDVIGRLAHPPVLGCSPNGIGLGRLYAVSGSNQVLVLVVDDPRPDPQAGWPQPGHNGQRTFNRASSACSGP